MMGLLVQAGGANPHGRIEFAHLGTELSAVVHPLRSPRGNHEVLGAMVLVSDITSEVNAKQARQDLIAQLSHELKTPLHVINMYSEMMVEEPEGVDPLTLEAGNTIHDEVERITALINNILSLSRIEMGSIKVDRTRTRLDDLLRDSVMTLSEKPGRLTSRAITSNRPLRVWCMSIRS